jgi:hypothetical protein
VAIEAARGWPGAIRPPAIFFDRSAPRQREEFAFANVYDERTHNHYDRDLLELR